MAKKSPKKVIVKIDTRTSLGRVSAMTGMIVGASMGIAFFLVMIFS